VPILLGAAVKFLSGINDEMRTLSRSMAVTSQVTSDHERRLDNLERLFLRQVEDP
jgi:hypothetical protein